MTESEKLDLLLSKMSTVENRMGTMEERMGTMEEGMATMGERMSSMEERMATKAELSEIKEQMATKAELSEIKEQMATKAELSEVKESMVTKGYLCTKMREMENNILREVDTVQEKSNAHYEELKKQIKLMRDRFYVRDLDSIKSRLSVVEVDVANLKAKVILEYV